MLDRPSKVRAYQTFIDGAWCDAASGKAFESFDPYTGEAWATIPECDKADVDRACEAAARAFETGPWPAMMGAEPWRLGSPNVILPSPPKFVPSKEKSAVFCEMDINCP